MRHHATYSGTSARRCERAWTKDNQEGLTMKRYLILAAIGLSACDSPAEIAAGKKLDAACLEGDIQACAAVQRRVDARNQSIATTAAGF